MSVQIPDQFKCARIRRRIGCRAIPQWLLINANHFVDMFDSRDSTVRTGASRRAMQTSRQRVVKDIIDQGAFAATTWARHNRQCSERDLYIDLFQVVVPGAQDIDRVRKWHHRSSTRF